MDLKSLVCGAGLLAVAGSTVAAPVAIINGGFEDLYFGDLPAQYAGVVPPTAFPTGPAPNGWSAFGLSGGAFVGVLNPGTLAADGGTNFPAGAPEGNNVALLFYNDFAGGPEFGIEQTLGATLALNTTYTLQVEVGNIASGISSEPTYAGFGFFNLDGFPGYRIELRAGTTIIAQDLNSLSPGEGLFQTSTIQATIGAAHADVGAPLSIRLVNLNLQDVNDPAVDLEVDFDNVRLDAAPVPLPATLFVMLPAALLLCRRRRQD